MSRALQEAIDVNLDSLQLLRDQANSIQDIISDNRVSQEVRSLLVRYRDDLDDKFKMYFNSFSTVIDRAKYD